MWRFRLFLATCVLMSLSHSLRADDSCPWNATYDVPLDLVRQAPLEYTRDIRVFNIYWHGSSWDSIAQHKPAGGFMGFQKADIDAATISLMNSGYFSKSCQYGVPRLTWAGSHDTGQELNPCPREPLDPVTMAEVQGFASCEESAPFTDVPTAIGVPNYLIPGSGGLDCLACGLADPCFDHGACSSVPNSSGDLLLNVFLPADHQWKGFPNACSTPGSGGVTGFHFEVPSNDIGYPVAPIALTQGRPIYVTVIFLSCFHDIAEAMHAVSHEMLETVTTPFPFAFWAALTSPTGVADPGNNEAGDICEKEPLPDGSGFKIDPVTGKRIDLTDAKLGWLDSKGAKQTMDISWYWSNYDNACVSIDDFAPALTIAGTPPPNSAGWNNTNVNVTITATDSASDDTGIRFMHDSASGAAVVAQRTLTPPATFPFSPVTDSFLISPDGITTIAADATDNAGLTAAASLDIRIDRVMPKIIGTPPAPTPNAFGWNNTPVSASFTCSDDLSGIARCDSPVILSTEGLNESLVGRAIDNADNESDITYHVNIDRTAPTVSYSGNAASYTVDQFVNISCAASDALSGVRSTSCAPISGPAYSFTIGTNSYSAGAVDYADNSSQTTISFMVVVTFASLENLTNRFVSQPGIANAMTTKLQAAEAAATRGNLNAKTAKLNAFANDVSAQSGKSLTDADAAVLLHLVAYL